MGPLGRLCIYISLANNPSSTSALVLGGRRFIPASRELLEATLIAPWRTDTGFAVLVAHGEPILIAVTADVFLAHL